jgi:hypothetical protein
MKMSMMKQRNSFEYWQRIGRHMNHLRLFVWFFGVGIPVQIGIGAFIHWHNNLVGEPTPAQLLMRMAVMAMANGFVILVVAYKVLLPAIKAEKQQSEQEKNDKT